MEEEVLQRLNKKFNFIRTTILYFSAILLTCVFLCGCSEHLPLADAAEEGNLNEVKDLIKKGYDINKGGVNNYTPLIVSAGRGRIQVVKFLLSKGAKVNAQTFWGENALMAASRYTNDKAVVEVLLKNGADINAKDKEGKTALDYACKNKNPSSDIIKLLEEAEIALKKNDLKTP